ncbi:hypothetical protein ASF30_12045 [Leifsonia sp. Leaf264]|nr:hypothetical protein ASF30_12045 [Leifsonia sp. Leaf264]
MTADELRYGPKPADPLFSDVVDTFDVEKTVIVDRRVRRPAPLIELAAVHLDRYAELLEHLESIGMSFTWVDEDGETPGDSAGPRQIAARLRAPSLR